LRSHAGHDHAIRGMFTIAVEESAYSGDESVGAIREVMGCDLDRTIDLIELVFDPISHPGAAGSTPVGIEVIHQACTETEPG
jgi:hypothetical protein